MRRHCSVFVCFNLSLLISKSTDSEKNPLIVSFYRWLILQHLTGLQSDGRVVVEMWRASIVSKWEDGAQYCLFKTNIYKNAAS